MGGNAFPKLSDRIVRLSAPDFIIFQDKTVNKLRQMDGENPRAIFLEIISYHNKPSFGDLDIIYTQFLENSILPSPTDFMEALGAVDMVRNGPVTSYAVPYKKDKLFQVDLIRVGIDEFDSAYSYFAYNDLGNLLGRIFHRAGFKLGHTGMAYVIRNEQESSHVLKEVVVTHSWKLALEFAGYDYLTWLQGFDELHDVFQYVVTNPLANRTIFRLDETNHQARVRDRKRKTYQLFLKWINDPDNSVPEKESISKNDLRKQWLSKAFEQFPEFKKDYDDAIAALKKNNAAKEKFNGNIVMQITGLSGKELGNFMTSFSRDFIESECQTTRDDWAIYHTASEIAEMIQKWYFKMKSK